MSIFRVQKGGAGITGKEAPVIEAACLGSTLAICISDTANRISGIAVPLLSSFKGKDVGGLLDLGAGLKKLFSDFSDAGGNRNTMRLWLVGAARFMEEPRELALGVQLYASAKKILEKNGMKIHGEHVGGTFDRSVRLEAGAEQITVLMPYGKEITL